MTKTIDKFVASMSQIPEDYKNILYLIKANEISHIVHFLHELDKRDIVPRSLGSELDSAITFCQRALANPSIQDFVD